MEETKLLLEAVSSFPEVKFALEQVKESIPTSVTYLLTVAETIDKGYIQLIDWKW